MSANDMAARMARACYRAEDRTLSSGLPSGGLIRHTVARSLYELQDHDRAFAGVETGGSLLAVAVGAVYGDDVLDVRKDGTVVGSFEPGEAVDLVEDVVTTGGSVLRAARALRAAGLVVDTVVCLIDREQGGRENLAAEGLTLRALWTASELLAALGVEG